MQIIITKTLLSGLLVIETKVFEDPRGFFFESYSKSDLSQVGIHDEFVQENHSRSQKGALRGLHYQDKRAPMAKLVRCTLGKIFDVAVDLRSNSPTFGKWFSIELSDENMKILYVPIGFAHGLQTTSAFADIQYKQSGYYTPAAEGTIAWNDPDLNIPWPIPHPLLSEKDRHGMSFKEYSNNPIFS